MSSGEGRRARVSAECGTPRPPSRQRPESRAITAPGAGTSSRRTTVNYSAICFVPTGQVATLARLITAAAARHRTDAQAPRPTRPDEAPPEDPPSHEEAFAPNNPAPITPHIQQYRGNRRSMTPSGNPFIKSRAHTAWTPRRHPWNERASHGSRHPGQMSSSAAEPRKSRAIGTHIPIRHTKYHMFYKFNR